MIGQGRGRPASTLFGCALIALAAVLANGSAAHAQTRLVADPEASLGWWQMNPHLGHLWATTCPSDPGWRPGEGVTPAGAGDFVKNMHRRRGSSNILDSIVPLYPRRAVRSVCKPAVRADLTVGDTETFRNTKGVVALRVDQLYTGDRLRNQFTNTLFEVQRWPEIIFTVDSVSNVQKIAGDTTLANAFGQFMMHGVTKPQVIPVKITNEAGGLRVQGQLQINAKDMIEVYQLSKWKLGLGVGTNIWQLLHMGLDVVLKDPSAITASPGSSQ